MKMFLRSVWPPSATGLIFVLALLWFLAASPQPWLDRDLGWHMAAGEWILKHRAIPEHTLWSFTAENTRWYNLSWLWDAVIAFIRQQAGDAGLLYFTALLMAITFGVLTHLLRRLNVPFIKTVPALIIAAMTLTPFAVPRPQIVSYLLTVLFLMVLEGLRQQSDKRKYILLPLLMLIWANVHGAFLTGFIILAAYAVEAAMSRNLRFLRVLLLSGLGCTFAVFITPLGWEIIPAVLRTLHTTIAASVTEWKPFEFLQYPGASLYLLLFILVADFSSPTIPPAFRLLSFAWLVAGLVSFRHFPFFTLLSMPMLVLRWQRWLPQSSSTSFAAASVRQEILPAVLMFLTLLPPVYGYLTREERLRNPDTSIDDVIEYVRKQHPSRKFLNDYNLGGDLIHYAGGKIPLFVDGRAGTAYPESVLEDYLRFNGQEEGWEEILPKYKIDGIITYHNWPGMTPSFVFFYEAGAYRDRWKRTFRGRNASVFLRCGKGMRPCGED